MVSCLGELETMKDEFLLEINKKNDVKSRVTQEFIRDIFDYFSLIKNNISTSDSDCFVPLIRSILEYVKKSIFFLEGDSKVLYLLMQLKYFKELIKILNNEEVILKEHLESYREGLRLSENRVINYPYNVFRSEKLEYINIFEIVEHKEIQNFIPNKFRENIRKTEESLEFKRNERLKHDKNIKELEVKICNLLCGIPPKECEDKKCKVLKIKDWIHFSKKKISKVDTTNTITSISNEYFGVYYNLLSMVNHSNAIIEKTIFGKRNVLGDEIISLLGDIIGSYFLQLNNYFPIKTQKEMILWEQSKRGRV